LSALMRSLRSSRQQSGLEEVPLIDYDVTVAPIGTLGMQRLLEAVENAHPNDESEWIEFKADLDPNTKDGAAAIAKAVIAFANRDPDRAQRWCRGHAFVVLGLAPGNLAGAPEIDPADLHNKVNALLASPPPDWDPTPMTYKGTSLVVITVAPPKPGDPIACTGKSSGEVVDGNIYVRVPGKSERAKAADLRRLSARLAPASETLRDITVTTTGSIAAVNYPDNWVARWIEAEGESLLAPLTPKREPEELNRAHLGFPRAYPGIDSIIGVAASMRSQADRIQDMLTIKHEEERTEEQYRAEVEAYLDRCRENLPRAFETIRASEATPVRFSITNSTPRNYAAVLIRLRIEGDVLGYDWAEEFKGWNKYVGKRPRVWGPWRASTMPSGSVYPGFRGAITPAYRPQIAEAPRPRPRIENGGSVNVTCVPVDLRPSATEGLLTLHLVADRTVARDVRVTWTATATDVDGELSAELEVPLAAERVDLHLGRG
jgi:hypothetical protein